MQPVSIHVLNHKLPSLPWYMQPSMKTLSILHRHLVRGHQAAYFKPPPLPGFRVQAAVGAYGQRISGVPGPGMWP